MGIRMIDGEELRRLVPMDVAVDALEGAFGAGALPEAPLRSHLEVSAGALLTMPAAGASGVGVKLVTINPSNPRQGLPFIHALYALFDPDTLAPVAVIDGSALTSLRTAAVSGLATRYLARADAKRLVLFGAGVQARSHLEAMCAVRPVSEVAVVSRTLGRAEELADRAREKGLSATVAGPDAVAAADLVCTCTTSPTPVFDGAALPPGCHVNAVGSYRPDAREIDDDAVRGRAVVVETREAALSEAGDLVLPLKSGVIDEASIVELADVVRGRRVRTRPADITVFKSVGVAFEDLIVAGVAVERLAR